METTFRDLTCGDARPEHAGRATTLAGWVHRRRDLGQLIFLDLRDRYGVTQIVIDAAEAPGAHAAASDIRGEFVVQARGSIEIRREGTENPKLATGAVELRADGIEVLSSARTPAFPINEPDQEP
ncbi:MAG TPA: OB-fold nucleic acid binding domain-containing protein, partial [Candidatus Limnocylindrales bacterium]